MRQSGIMLCDLICHRDYPVSIVKSISVELEGESGEIWLRYHAELVLNELKLPDPAEPARAEGLWKTTCFELFLRNPGEAPYCEFNFSPSFQWAAYRFQDVRSGMIDLALPEAPQIFLDMSESHFALETTLVLPADLGHADFYAAMAAVIEETDGTKSYWALAHPSGKPDFHASDCFMLELPSQA